MPFLNSKFNKMKMQELRKYILDRSGIDVLNKSRKRPIPTARKVFIKIAKLKDNRLTNEGIGNFLGLDHSTVTVHLNSDIKYDLMEHSILDELYYELFPRKEKTQQDYIREITTLKKELEQIKKSVLIK
jgi:chromosomal replication initiation ATPase DnaA